MQTMQSWYNNVMDLINQIHTHIIGTRLLLPVLFITLVAINAIIMFHFGMFLYERKVGTIWRLVILAAVMVIMKYAHCLGSYLWESPKSQEMVGYVFLLPPVVCLIGFIVSALVYKNRWKANMKRLNDECNRKTALPPGMSM